MATFVISDSMYNMDEKNIDPIKTGEFIARLRQTHNMTQEELGNLVFISRKSVSKWETGRACPSIDMLKRLSTVFGVSLEELIEGDFNSTHVREKKLAYRIFKSKIFKVFSFPIILLGLAIISLIIYSTIDTSSMYSINYEDERFGILNGVFVLSSKANYINFGTMYYNLEDVDDNTTFNYTLYYLDEDVDRKLASFSSIEPVYLDNSDRFVKAFKKSKNKSLYLRVEYENTKGKDVQYDLELSLSDIPNNKYILEEGSDNVDTSISAEEDKDLNVEFLFKLSKEDLKKYFDGKTIVVGKTKYKIFFDAIYNKLVLKYKDLNIQIDFDSKRIILTEKPFKVINIKDNFNLSLKNLSKEELQLIKNIIHSFDNIVCK